MPATLFSLQGLLPELELDLDVLKVLQGTDKLPASVYQ